MPECSFSGIYSRHDQVGTSQELVSSCVYSKFIRIAKVKAAVKIAVNQGDDEALRLTGDKEGEFVWKDSYVFGVTADQALVLSHPVKPKLVGKNLLHVKDVNGVLLFAEIAKVASSESGKGWVDYMWPKPGAKTPSPKHTYVEKVPGKNLAFGAGYYE